jgi:hypothetical protein
MEKSLLEKFGDEKNQIDQLFELASNPDADMTQISTKVFELYEDVLLLDKWNMHYRVKSTVISLYLKRKRDQDPLGKGVSSATAYRRFSVMERIFGPLHRSEKEYKRAFYIDWFTKLLKKMEDAGQWRSIPGMAKVLTDIEDLDKKNDITRDMLESMPTFIMGYFPETVGEQWTEEMVEKEKAKLEKRRAKEDDAEEIDFQDVKDE